MALLGELDATSAVEWGLLCAVMFVGLTTPRTSRGGTSGRMYSSRSVRAFAWGVAASVAALATGVLVGSVLQQLWVAANGVLLRYAITLGDDEVAVELRIDQPFAGRRIQLAGAVSDDLFRLTGLNATGSRSGTLRVDTLGLGQPHNRRAKPRSHYLIQTGWGETVVVKYRINPGAEMVSSQNSPDPEYVFGYQGTSEAVVSGSNVFLIPEGPVGSVTVQVRANDGGRVYATWDSTGVAVEAYKSKKGDMDALIRSIIASGRFSVKQNVVAGIDFRCIVSQSLAAHSDTEDLARTAGQVAEEVAAFFGATATGRDRSRYTLFLLPDVDTGHRVFIPASPAGQAVSMGSPVAARWRELATDMALIWADRKTLRVSPEQAWLLQGITELAAIRALSNLGLIDGRQLLLQRYLEYYARRDVSLPMRSHPMSSREQEDGGMDRVLDVGRAIAARSLIISAWVDSCLNNHREAGIGYVLRDLAESRSAQNTLDVEERLRVTAGIPPARWKGVVLGDSLIGLTESTAHQRLREPSERPQVGLDPALSVIVTGFQDGLLENCGCKLSEDTGGIARLSTALQRLRQETDPVITIALGRLLPGRAEKARTPVMREEVDLYLALSERLRYDAVGLSRGLFLMGAHGFEEHRASVRVPFVNSNIWVRGHLLAGRGWRTVQAGSHTVGLISVCEAPILGSEPRLDRGVADLSLADPVAAVRRAIDEAQDEKWTHTLVFGRLSAATAAKIAQMEPVDVLVVEKPEYPARLDSRGRYSRWADDTAAGVMAGTVVVIPRASGAIVTRIDLFEGREGGLNFDVVEVFLGPDYEKDESVVGTLDEFCRAVFRASDRRPLFEWADYMSDDESAYVGVDRCAACHESEYQQWRITGHASAMQTLEKVGRQYVAKCTICHVVGQGYPSGFKGPKDRGLRDVQCEMCHGPGGAHARAPMTSRMIRMPAIDHCEECHDQKHSDFDPEAYFPRIVH